MKDKTPKIGKYCPDCHLEFIGGSNICPHPDSCPFIGRVNPYKADEVGQTAPKTSQSTRRLSPS